MSTSTNRVDKQSSAPEQDSGRSDTAFFEMDQRKNEFLATLAHELRNPLAPIKNGLQLMAYMNLSEEAEVVRAMITRQVEQVVHLVEDLLDVTRISCGKVVLDKQICKVSAIAEAAIEQSKILISENGIALEVIDNSQDACVCGDIHRLTQVFCNLLNNSAKYGHPGGKIVLSIEVASGVVVIRVQDNGIGITVDRLDDIFRMYSQIANGHERGSAGLGIGLALVRSLIELHDGSVNAESEGINCGSTFTIRLPLVSGIPLENGESKTPSNMASRSFRVLVVDDMRAMRTVTEQLLGKLGHVVQVAENGKMALEVLDSFKPDIIFSDITMPEMNGHELARRIRARPDLNGVYLVAMTGYGQASDRELALGAGFDRHLTKPVAFQCLRELLDELKHGL